MRIETDRATLLRLLTYVHGIAGKGSTIPVLACVRLVASVNGVSATTTDMEITVTAAANMTVAEPGECLAPAATLHDIVRKLPDGAAVTLHHRADALTLDMAAGRFRTAMTTLPIEDFPDTAAHHGGNHRFLLSAPALRTLIDRTRFAMSTEETRYYLCGLYLHPAPRHLGLRAVATDGHRLAMVDIPHPDGLPDDAKGVIIPRRTVLEVRKLLADTSGDVDVQLSDSRIVFTTDQVSITSKLVDGTFPEYERVIPADGPNVLRVSRAALTGAAGRVAAIDTEKARGVKLSMNGGGMMVAAAQTTDGTATEDLDPADFTYAGDALEIGFQVRYLADIAEQCGNDIELRMADSNAPAKVVDPADDSALFVLMPMRV